MPVKRQKGQRRWGLDPEFPLMDSSGILVTANRRRLPDRRLNNISLEERLMMFAEMPLLDPEQLR